MKWYETPESSNIVAFAYSPKLTALFIEFKEQRIYEYAKIPKKKIQEFRKAESKGKFFHAIIKTKYKCLPLRDRLNYNRSELPLESPQLHFPGI